MHRLTQRCSPLRCSSGARRSTSTIQRIGSRSAGWGAARRARAPPVGDLARGSVAGRMGQAVGSSRASRRSTASRGMRRPIVRRGGPRRRPAIRPRTREPAARYAIRFQCRCFGATLGGRGGHVRCRPRNRAISDEYAGSEHAEPGPYNPDSRGGDGRLYHDLRADRPLPGCGACAGPAQGRTGGAGRYGIRRSGRSAAAQCRPTSG